MDSLILSRMSRLIFWLLGALSLYVLYRGHDMPGGGFVGGLMGAMAVTVIGMADGIPAARKQLVASPVSLIGAGMGAAFISGMPGLFRDGSYLSHQWLHFAGGFSIGTPFVFDLGVYLVVVGGVLAMIFRLYGEDAA